MAANKVSENPENKPYPSIRLFKNPMLEALSHVHPVVPALWAVPLVLYQLYLSSDTNLGFTWISQWFSLGILIWTLSEYLLHRYVFHFHATSNAGKRFVFLFHGIHHDDPNDPTRLVMPPIAAWVLAVMFYYGFKFIMGETNVHPFFAGFITGYLAYDYIHFATHHFKMKSPIAQYLKRNHMRHHFAESEYKWGVSSPLWDFILGTYEAKPTQKSKSQ